ncbi:MAG: ribosome maturation factor RimP [Pseudomonadota bacterium]
MLDNTHPITKQVAALIEPILDDMGFELVDLEYLSKHGRWVLGLYIDKEGGVTIDDCARVSGEIGDIIDVQEIIKHQYALEVSSPGLNRPLKKEKDFVWAIGKKVKIKTVAPINNRRNLTGYLTDFQKGRLYLDIEGKAVELPLSEVGKANLIYEF